MCIDFIDDVRPTMSELSYHGIDSVAYYGEVDIRSINESFDRLNGDVNVMVATTVFGVDISKPNILHIFRYDVPEKLGSRTWTCGQKWKPIKLGQPFFLRCNKDTKHGNVWIKGHLNNQKHWSRILNEYSESWKYVMSNQYQRVCL